MTRGIPYLIHKLIKLSLQNDLTFSMESISNEKGKNVIEKTDTYIKITYYESTEDDKKFESELDILVDNLKTTPL
jgi:hypothetical protein